MAKDILTDETGDIIIANGDLNFGNNDAQHIEDICMLSSGELKYAPRLGAGLVRLTNGRINPQAVVRDVELNLRADNWKQTKVKVIGSDIQVDAVR